MSTSKAQILQELQGIFAELFELDPQDVTLEARLYEDLDLDSIDAVDLIVYLQSKTDKQFKPEEFKSVKTVNDIVTIIDQEINNQ
ncbi:MULTISPECIES: acyl carrier protein [Cysteiniphilum]|uniref:Acyl carrier protein n=1 Tax=Cysteiniphilum litorale TaxID=2056700 RepID=A0A8J3EA19_9GAMM|nr:MULTISPECIES: acyl carrier protein [Cysteiniphilum]GGG07406.1 acyl carrier protein [Cysteiniphilum litorale]